MAINSKEARERLGGWDKSYPLPTATTGIDGQAFANSVGKGLGRAPGGDSFTPTSTGGNLPALKKKKKPVPKVAPKVPLYTNKPEKMKEAGAIPLQAGPERNDRFSNTGTFNAGQAGRATLGTTQSKPFVPLPLNEAARLGRLSGLTGEQYNERRETAYAVKQRADWGLVRDQSLEKTKASLTQPEYKIGFNENTLDERQSFVVGPRGKVEWPTKPEPEAKTKKSSVISYDEFSKLPQDEQGIYLNRLQKERPDDFMELARILKLGMKSPQLK